jgi:hypothetical protein
LAGHGLACFFDPELSWSSFWNIRGNSEWRGYRVYAEFLREHTGRLTQNCKTFVPFVVLRNIWFLGFKPHQAYLQQRETWMWSFLAKILEGTNRALRFSSGNPL